MAGVWYIYAESVRIITKKDKGRSRIWRRNKI